MTPPYSGTFLENYLKKQYPGIQIDLLSYPEDQYYTVLKSRLSTQNAADIIDIQLDYAGPNGVKELGPAGYLYPLYEVSENYSDLNEENLLISDGKVYGKAWQRMTLGITYNRTLFEKYGLSYPTCLEEFLDCCEILKNHGIQPLVIEGHNISSFQYPLYQIAANQLYPVYPDYDKQPRNLRIQVHGTTYSKFIFLFLNVDISVKTLWTTILKRLQLCFLREKQL